MRKRAVRSALASGTLAAARGQRSLHKLHANAFHSSESRSVSIGRHQPQSALFSILGRSRSFSVIPVSRSAMTTDEQEAAHHDECQTHNPDHEGRAGPSQEGMAFIRSR